MQLNELLKNAIADGGFGITLRSGEAAVVHTPKGPRTVFAVQPTSDDIEAFLRQLISSRRTREFREQGITRFMLLLDHEVRIVGAARRENDAIRVEIRRMAGTSDPKP